MSTEMNKTGKNYTDWTAPGDYPSIKDLPHLDKVVGVDSEDVEKGKEYFIKRATIDGAQKIKQGWFRRLELEKTNEDIEIIDFVSKAAAEYMQQHGRKKDVLIPLSNIHLLRKGGAKKYTKGRSVEGIHNAELNSVIADRLDSNLDLAILLFHEFVHALSYKAKQVTKTNNQEDKKIEGYRSGIGVVNREGNFEFFEDVEEAVVGLMTERFYNEKLKHHPLFSDEVGKNQKNGVMPDTTRMREVRILRRLIHDIFERNRDEFKDKEEIEDLFIDAQVNGNLLKIGRLIENTFGKGSFRKLGIASGKAESV